MGEFGLLGIGLPEEHGGLPGNCIMRGIVAEEIGKADLSLAFTLVSSYGTSMALLHGGSKKLQDEWIPGFIKGNKLGSISMTEPDCGSDLTLVRTKAKKEGGYYVINGEKNYVSWGLDAEANWVFVKTESDVNPWDLTALFLPLNLPGIAKSSFIEMGLYPVGHTSLYLEDVRVPFEYLLGEEGKALRLAAKTFPHTRMILSLSALGLAEVSLEEAINFAKQRSAFGKPIGKFEGVSFKIAEDATLIESTRWLCYRTLWLMDQGINCVKEIAMCKWWSTEVAFRTIYDALLLHGHKGYSSDYLLEQRLRDIIGYEMGEATSEIVKLSICEEILGKELRPFC
jgi:cyclohexanecarboxyl-CoA dehydrogenase